MKLIFLRHAQSEYNIKNLINQDSKIKVNITEKGKKQAIDAGEKLKNDEIQVIFASEFLRTQQTAENVRERRKIEIKVDKRINEGKVGYEGKDVKNYREDRGKSGMKINKYKKSEEFESFHDIKLRVENFIKWLKGENYDCVLVVTHEICCQCARSIFENISEEEAFSVPFDNCGILRYEI